MLIAFVMHAYLAQNVSSGDGGGSEIITIVYVLTGISLIVGFVVGTYKYVQRQKKKWTEEGIDRQKQSQAMADNTKQMMLNTEAIDKLTSEFGKFAMSVREEMNGLGARLGRLENWRQKQTPDHSKE
jgi:uncharacterized protein HemX